MPRHAMRLFAAKLPALAFAGLLLAIPAGVAANTNEPIAQTGGMTATLPLLGTSLTVGVTLDDVGNISAVTLDPAGALTATKTTDHAVKFSNTGGTAKVTVKAKGDKLSIKATAKLDALTGTGSWSADVFGTGANSTVAYTVGKDAGGKPTLAIGAVTAASGLTSEVKPTESKEEDGKTSVSGSVIFARDGFTKQLKISVKVDEDDGDASLNITLSGKDRQELSAALADLLGPRMWSAHLCNGTPVTVNYHVAAGGTIVFDSATGASATTKTTGHGFRASFTDQHVWVAVRLKALEDGTYHLSVRGHSGQCGGHHETTASTSSVERVGKDARDDKRSDESRKGSGDHQGKDH
jgi:hypothetical protein